MPFLSIVIPVLKPDFELDRCIHSLNCALAKEVTSEIVIVTPSRFVSAVESRCPGAVVVAESRRGIYAAMNDGARISRGRYLYFLGQDDVVLPAFGLALRELRDYAPFALFCDVYWGSRVSTRIIPPDCESSPATCATRVPFTAGPHSTAMDRTWRRMRVQADHLLNIKVLWDRQEGVEGALPGPAGSLVLRFWLLRYES